MATEVWSVSVGLDSTLVMKGAKEIDRGTKKAGTSMQRLGQKADAAKKKLKGLKGASSQLRTALTAIGFGGFGIALISATKSALAFDKAMTEVTTLIDASFDPTESLTEVVRELSKEYAQSPTEQAKALYQVISAGATNAAEATKTLTAANKLAVGGVTDVATAADGLTSVLNAYGLGADEATRISDTMFVAMRAGKTTIGELSASVGLLAPIAAATGVTIEEMFGAVAALTKGGLSTSMAMTGLRQALVNVLKPQKQAAAAAKDLGVEFNSTALAEKGLVGFMAELTIKAKGNTDALVALFGSVEGLNAMMALTSDTGAKDFNKIIDDMTGGIVGLIGKYEVATANSAALGDAIRSLVAPSTEAMQATKELGFAFNATTAKQMGFEKFMNEVTIAMKGNREELAKLFGSIEAYEEAMVRARTGGGEGLLAIMEDIAGQMGQTEIAVQKVTESIEFQAKQVKAQLTDAMLGLGNTMLTIFGPAIQSINENFETFRRVAVTAIAVVAAAYLTKLLVALTITSVAFVYNTSVATATAAAYLGVTTAAGTASIALTVLKGTLIGATGGIGLLIIGIAAAIAGLVAWISSSNDAGEAAGRLRENMTGLAEAFKNMGEEAQLQSLQVGFAQLDLFKGAIRDLELDAASAGATLKNALAGMGDTKDAVAGLKEANDALLANKEAIKLQTEALFIQAEASDGANAAFAKAKIMTTGLIGEYQLWRMEMQKTAAAREEEARQSREVQTELDKENHIVAGLTKVQQRRWSQIAKIATARNDLNRKHKDDLETLSIAYGMMITRVGGVENAEWDLAKATAVLNKKFEEDTEALTGNKAAMDRARKATEDYDKMVRKLDGDLDPVTKSQNMLADKLLAFAKVATKAGKAGVEYAKGIKKIMDAHKNSKIDNFTRQIEDLKAGTDEVALATLEHNRSMQELHDTTDEAMRQTPEYIELQRLKKEAHDANVIAIAKEAAETARLVDLSGAAAKRLQTLWERGLENIQDAFAKAFRNIFDNGSNFFDDILDAFKDMIANMLSTWAASGIMNILSGNAFGGGGNSLVNVIGSLAGGGVGGGVGGGSGGGVVGSAASSVFGPGTAIGDAFAGFTAGVSAFFQGAQAWFAGTEIGIGGAGSLMGGTFTPAGTNAVAAANPGAFSAGGVVAGAGIGAITGAVADMILGGRGNSTRNAIFSAIGGAIGSIWGVPGAIIGGAIGSLVDNLFGGAKRLESATLTLGVASDQFFGETEDVVSKQRSFFRGKKLSTTTKDISGSLQTLEDVFIDFTNGLMERATALGADATGFLDDFSFDRELDIKGRSGEQIQAMLTDFMEDAIRGSIREFLRDVEDMPEEILATLGLFTESTSRIVEGLGRFGHDISIISGNFDIDEFLRAFDALGQVFGMFDLDLEGVVATAVEEANLSATDAYARALEGYREVVDAYDGSIESLEALAVATAMITDVQATLIGVFMEVRDAINGMFGDTRQTIAEALLSEEELYDLRQTQVDALVSQLSSAVDPAEIARLSEEINALTLESFNLLDEDQQAAMQGGFLDFLDEVITLANERIDEGVAGVNQDQAALEMEVSAELIATAAQISADAASEFRMGVAEFREYIRENRNNSGGDRTSELLL